MGERSGLGMSCNRAAVRSRVGPRRADGGRMSLERPLAAGLMAAALILSLGLGAGAQSPRRGKAASPKPAARAGRARPARAVPRANKMTTPGATDPAGPGVEGAGALVPRRAGGPGRVGEGDGRSGSAAMELQTGHMGPVWVVGVSPDGKLAASAGSDGTVKLWDAAAGILVRTLRVSAGEHHGVAFSPDGKLLATGGENQVRLWEIPGAALRATWNVEGGSIRNLSFAPDGRSIAVMGGGDGSVRLYEYPSGRLARSLDARAAWPERMTFSPDGRWLACTSAGGTVKLWDARTGNLQWSLAGEGAVAFSPDSKILASGAPQGVNLWNIETRALERTLPMSGPLRGIAYLPDGRTVFAYNGDMQWWDTATGTSVRGLGGYGDTVAIAMSADGATLVGGTFSGFIHVMDMGRGLVKHTMRNSEPVYSVAPAPQGDLLLSGGAGGTVRLWDLRSGTLVRSLEGLTGDVWSARFSPDGSLAAAGDTSGSIRLWEVVSGSPLREVGRHSAAVEALAFSPDGTALASSSADGSHRVWDLQGQSPLRILPGKKRSLPGASAAGLEFSPDGRLLASVVAQDVQLWDTATWQVAQTLRGPAEVSGLRGEAQVSSLAFSPDGSTLAVGSCDETVRLWDVKTGQQLRMLTGHRGVVFSLGFSPDGQVLAGGEEYAGVLCWDVRSGELRHKLQGHSGHVRSVAFAPDSRTLVSSSADGSIRVWDAPAGRPLATFLTPTPPTPAGIQAAPAAPRPAAPPGASVAPAAPGTLRWEIAAGGPRGTGLLLRDGADGATERAERGGRSCVGNRPGSQYVYFQAARAPGTGVAYVMVEYFDDRPAGPLGLEYDSRDPQAGPLEGAYAPAEDVAGGVRSGSGEWRRAAFRLAQPRWERRQNLQSDFRLNGWDGGPLFVRSVQVTAARPADWEALKPAPPAPSKDYLVLTPEGYYAASPGADRYLQFGVEGVPLPAECFRARYERPDLIEQALAGQKVPAPPPLQGPYPPRLSVLERPAEKLAGERLQLTVRLEDDSAVLRLACFLNGSRVPAQVQRLPSPPGAGGSNRGDPYTERGTFRVTVTLPPEASSVKLALVAYDDDELQSPRQELFFSHTPVVNPAAGRLLGLCVGVSRYRTARLNLKFADQDAASLTQALNTQPGLYKGSAVRDLRNEHATAAGVKAALDGLAGQVTKQDTVVLFFSGHGWQAEDGSFYFATHETELGNLRGTALPWSEVVQRLGELSRKGKRVLVLLDACHSGSAASSDQLVRAVLAAEAGVTVLASSRGGEYSFEQQELRHGAFTAALLEALGGKAAPESQTLSLWELRGYVERRVRELTAERQHPQVPYLQDFDTGAPFLVASRAAD